MLDGKDREQLHTIAGAMGVKGVTRMRKADLVDAILDAAPATARPTARTPPTASPRRRHERPRPPRRPRPRSRPTTPRRPTPRPRAPATRPGARFAPSVRPSSTSDDGDLAALGRGENALAAGDEPEIAPRPSRRGSGGDSASGSGGGPRPRARHRRHRRVGGPVRLRRTRFGLGRAAAEGRTGGRPPTPKTSGPRSARATGTGVGVAAAARSGTERGDDAATERGTERGNERGGDRGQPDAEHPGVRRRPDRGRGPARPARRGLRLPAHDGVPRPAATTSTCRRRRCAASRCARATSSRARRARRRATRSTRRCCASTRSTA